MSYKDFAEPVKTNFQVAHNASNPASAQSFQENLHPVSRLQRQLGNHEIARLIQAKRLSPSGEIIGLQRKLTVGAANDQYEQEADQVARQVMTMPAAAANPAQRIASAEEDKDNSMQRQPEEDKDKMLQTKPLAASITPLVVQRDGVSKEEDKEKSVQARFLTGTHGESMQRQPEEDKDKILQTKPLAASITPFVQREMMSSEEDKEKSIQGKSLTQTRGEPIQRQPEEDKDKKEPVQAKSAGSMFDSFEAGADVESQVSQSKGHGSPLPDPVRSFMEPRFGVDFGHVRVHTGNDALQMNQAVGAQAFTHGSDIYYGAGSSPSNLELTAHELTHVVQQTGSSPLQAKGREEETGLSRKSSIQRICAACAAEDKEKKESSPVSVQAKRLHKASSASIERSIQRTTGTRAAQIPVSSSASSSPSIRRTPAPGRNFGTYRYCGFGITTPIPGFIKGKVTDDFDVDYTTGCRFVGWNAWDSVWELYDANNDKLDSNEEAPHGDYTIPASKLNTGTPSDGTSSKWSLWYRITESNPWVSDDNDAYPYDYKTFDVFSEPFRDPHTSLIEETGPIIWQKNFKPAEDGASLDYTIATSTQRSTDESQTTSVSGTIGGSQDAQIGFTFDGLTGGFSRNLSYSATASISRTHSVSVSTSKNETFTFHQPNLRGGVTYKITARPLFHRINGSVQLISHRDGVVSSSGDIIEGGIRTLKGLDISVDKSEPEGGAGSAAAYSCTARCQENCNGEATRYLEGRSTQNCSEATQNAKNQAARGCYPRHCSCRDTENFRGTGTQCENHRR